MWVGTPVCQPGAAQGGGRAGSGLRPSGMPPHTRLVPGASIREWVNGGETNIEDLVMLCRTHHRMIHQSGWEVRMHLGGRNSFRLAGWTRDKHPDDNPCSYKCVFGQPESRISVRGHPRKWRTRRRSDVADPGEDLAGLEVAGAVQLGECVAAGRRRGGDVGRCHGQHDPGFRVLGECEALGERLAGVDTPGGARMRQTQAVHPTDKDNIVHGEPPGASLPPV